MIESDTSDVDADDSDVTADEPLTMEIEMTSMNVQLDSADITALQTVIPKLSAALAAATPVAATAPPSTVTATPTFNPPPGAYPVGTPIALACADSNAAMYVTEDGSVPIDTSPTYSAPFVLAAGMTLSVIAVAPNKTGSNVAKAIYTIAASTGGGGGTTTTAPSAVMTTSGGKIFDTNGKQFKLVFASQCHGGDATIQSYGNFGINAVRIPAPGSTAGNYTAGNVAEVKAAAAVGVDTIWCTFASPGGSAVSGDQSPQDLLAIANYIASIYSQLEAYEKHLIIEIANEFGPQTQSGTSSAAFLAAYQPAIKVIRAAGYKCPLMIDGDLFGQGEADLIANAAALKAADPLGNIILSLHIYGLIGGGGSQAVQEANMKAAVAKLAACQTSTGIPCVVGEFGPGLNIGPSPTLISPQAVVAACEANGIGWGVWALDDNNLTNGQSNNAWFSMTTTGPGIYDGKTASQLTSFGVIMEALIKANAVKATDF